MLVGVAGARMRAWSRVHWWCSSVMRLRWRRRWRITTPPVGRPTSLWRKARVPIGCRRPGSDRIPMRRNSRKSACAARGVEPGLRGRPSSLRPGDAPCERYVGSVPPVVPQLRRDRRRSSPDRLPRQRQQIPHDVPRAHARLPVRGVRCGRPCGRGALASPGLSCGVTAHSLA